MGIRVAFVLAVVASVAASCSDGRDEASNAAGSNGAVASPAADANAAGQPPATAAAASYTLAGNGLVPGLTFGMTQAEAVKAATAAFGTPDKTEHNDECGEGPMDFAHFGDLQLGFQDGKFAGWSLSGPKPMLHTASGLAIGAPRSALGDTPIDEDSSIGPEFDIGGVGGFLDDKDTVMALWAGLPCQFR